MAVYHFEEISDEVYRDGARLNSENFTPMERSFGCTEDLSRSMSSKEATTVAIPKPSHSQNKALRCIEISQRMFPHESDEGLESIAVELMHLTDSGINGILQRLRLRQLRTPADQSFFSISLIKESVPGTGITQEVKEIKSPTKESVPGTGILQEVKKVKRDRYSILLRTCNEK